MIERWVGWFCRLKRRLLTRPAIAYNQRNRDAVTIFVSVSDLANRYIFKAPVFLDSFLVPSTDF